MEKEIVPVMKQFVIKPQNKQNFLIRNCTILSNMEMENGCITLPVPPELSGLTQCEEVLIARAFPVMQVYVRKGHNTISSKGHSLTSTHNVENVATILPKCPENLPMIVFAVKSRNNIDIVFNVR